MAAYRINFKQYMINHLKALKILVYFSKIFLGFYTGIQLNELVQVKTGSSIYQPSLVSCF